MVQSIGWVAPASAKEWAEEAGETAFLHRCGPLFQKAVLVVPSGPSRGWSVLRRAKAAGAMVTALCAPERAQDAREAGADAVMDPERQDPTCYRGAWAVIYDPAGRIGFARAAPSLDQGGVYVTFSARWADWARALVARLSGGPRLLRLRD